MFIYESFYEEQDELIKRFNNSRLVEGTFDRMVFG